MSNYLPINVDTFGFINREQVNGTSLKNQCGRDFLYYALHFYYPELHNREVGNPVHIREHGTFGLKMPPYLAWTSLQFKDVPNYLQSLGLALTINGRAIRGYTDFVSATFPFRSLAFEEALRHIEQAVDGGRVTGIDVPIGMGGLLDHVMFVEGYDTENLYVFDSHKVARVPYEKVTPPEDTRYIMKFPKNAVQKMWGRFGRVWEVKKVT